MISNKYAVYIMTNKRHTVLYVGMTGDLIRRFKHHKGQYRGFTAKYNVVKLVYYELHKDKKTAFKREKQIKNLLRSKKEMLINKHNLRWRDLYDELS